MFHHVLHGIEPDAAPRDVGNAVLQRKAGQEQKLEQLGLGQRRRRLGIYQFSFDDARPQPPKVDATPVVGDDDVEIACAVTRLHLQNALFRLSRRPPLFGRFDAVIDGIANEVSERRLELSENVAIDLRRLARDLQLHPFAQGAREIAHQPRKSMHHVAKGTHPARKRFGVQPMREVHRSALEVVEIGQPVYQQTLAIYEPALCFCERGLGVAVQCMERQRIAKAVERARRFVMQPLEPQQRFGKSLHPTGLDARLAGQPKQPVETLGGYTKDAIVHLACLRQWTGCLPIVTLQRSALWQLGLREHGGQPGEARVDFPAFRTIPLLGIALRCLRNEHEQVDAAQKPVDVMLLQADTPALRGHKAVFERVRNTHASSQADDTGRPFEGMRSAHTGLELVGCFRIALQREKPCRQNLGLAFGVDSKQIDHRDMFQIDAHAKLRFRAINKS